MKSQAETILVVDEKFNFAGVEMDGDVLLLALEGYDIHAASKRRPYPRASFYVAFPPHLVPSMDDCGWMEQGTVRVVLQFPKGILKLPEVPPTTIEAVPAPESEHMHGLSPIQIIADLHKRVQFLVNWVCLNGVSSDQGFTFPDGEFWGVTRNDVIPEKEESNDKSENGG